MSLVEHAKREFEHAGWLKEDGTYGDEMQQAICQDVLQLLEVFAEQGHSGSSAPYAIELFTTLAKFKPIGQLTGEDDEWNLLDYGCEPKWQNKRASHVFKESDGSCYDINGKVFWEWALSFEDGQPYKSYYTCRDSRVPVTFPYTIPKEPEYVYRYSDADPQQPAQDENGFL